MKNRFKFRVWHKELQKFLPPEEWLIDLNGNLRFIDLSSGSGGDTIYPITKKNLYVIQQFTGLSDRNSKEIYEGDILSCSGYDFRIFWNNKLSSFRAIIPLENSELYYDGLILDECIIRNPKVIGNIFEVPKELEKIKDFQNPELLK